MKHIAVQTISPPADLAEMIFAKITGGYPEPTPKAVILVAYASGALPSVLTPHIAKATKRGIPIFGIRNAYAKNWRTEWTDFEEEVSPATYVNEAEAIGAGLIPLRVNLHASLDTLPELHAFLDRFSTAQGMIEAAVEEYNSDRWNDRIDTIRKQYGPPDIWLPDKIVARDAEYVKSVIQGNPEAIQQGRAFPHESALFSHYDLVSHAGEISAVRIEAACEHLARHGFLEVEGFGPEKLKIYRQKPEPV